MLPTGHQLVSLPRQYRSFRSPPAPSQDASRPLVPDGCYVPIHDPSEHFLGTWAILESAPHIRDFGNTVIVSHNNNLTIIPAAVLHGLWIRCSEAAGRDDEGARSALTT